MNKKKPKRRKQLLWVKNALIIQARVIRMTSNVSIFCIAEYMEICCEYKMITHVQAAFEGIRNNFDNDFIIFTQRQIITERIGKAPLTKPRNRAGSIDPKK